MADTLTATIRAVVEATLVNTLTGSTASSSVTIGDAISAAITDGTSANLADKLWSSKGRALTAGASEDIDLYDFGSIDLGAGAGKDPLGQTITLAEVVAVLIKNNGTGTLIVGGKGNSTAWISPFNANTDTIKLATGGFMMLYAPTDPAYAVVDTTNHILKVAASALNCTYDIHIIGRSA